MVQYSNALDPADPFSILQDEIKAIHAARMLLNMFADIFLEKNIVWMNSLLRLPRQRMEHESDRERGDTVHNAIQLLKD